MAGAVLGLEVLRAAQTTQLPPHHDGDAGAERLALLPGHQAHKRQGRCELESGPATRRRQTALWTWDSSHAVRREDDALMTGTVRNDVPPVVARDIGEEPTSQPIT